MRRQLLRRRIPLAWAVAWRYLRGRRSRILSSTALAALAATALGVTAMVVAMALMTGYTEDLRRKLIGLQGEIAASPIAADAFDRDLAAVDAVRRLDGVRRVERVAYGEGAVTSPAAADGVAVVIRGVETGRLLPKAVAEEDLLAAPAAAPEPRDDAVEIGPRTVDSATLAGLRRDAQGVPGILLGAELGRRLEVEGGDVLRLVILQVGERRPKFHYRSVRVVDTFTTGFAQFDAGWVLIDRELLAGARGGGYDFLEIQLADATRTEETADRVEDLLGPEWAVQRWNRLNRDLFAALALQEGLLFLVLGLIVVVSTFNVAATLVILVRERLQDIGVLASIGLAPRQLWAIFVTYGVLLGTAGVALGVGVGTAASWAVTELRLIRFPPEIAEIYFIDSVPFRVEAGDLAAIIAFALAVTLAACSLPALRAARIRPADALRDE